VSADSSSPPGQSAEVIEALLASTQYRLCKYLGRGGMGAVYEVEHRFLGRRFVLKVLHARFAGEPQFVDRMRVEAQSMARLHHSNIVDVVDFWTAVDGRPCIVMELLQGRTLAQELAQRRKLPVGETVTIIRQVLYALGAAHEIGIVHRDVKPENIFLTNSGIVKVLDFGVARVLPAVANNSLMPLALPTDTGAIVGSPRFVSPEGAAGQKVDERADIYSVGLITYVMLAGRGPFDALRQAQLEPPSRFAGSDVSAGLDSIVIKAIAEHPDARYQTVAGFLSALDQFVPRTASQWPR
jgi:serine/threonine protein kinase